MTNESMSIVEALPSSREVFMYPAEGIKIMLWQTEVSERLGSHEMRSRITFLILEIADLGGCGKAFNVWDPDGNLLRLCYRPS